MKKNTETKQDELTEKMHSEFTISPEAELRIKVKLALADMKECNYTVAEVCELYGLREKDLGIVGNS